MDQYLLDTIYGAAVAPEMWKTVLSEVCRAFGSQSGVLAFSGDDTVLSAISVAHGVFEAPSVVGDYFSYYAPLDSAVPLYASLPTGALTTTSRAFSRRSLAKNEFYNDFFLKLGLSDSIGGNLVRDHRGTAMFTIQRAVGAGEFRRGDVVALKRLMPHLQRAIQLHRALAPTRRAAAAFVEGLDDASVGIVALDERGHVWHRNRTAAEIVDRRDGLILLRDEGLSAVDGNVAARLARLIGAVLAGDPPHAGGQVKVARPEGQQPYSVLVSPMPGERIAPFDVAPGRGVIVLINDPDRSRGKPLAVAMARFRLTPAELALLGALVEGQSLREYCEERRISANTGKFHLRALFAKTEARSQADLVRIALLATHAD